MWCPWVYFLILLKEIEDVERWNEPCLWQPFTCSLSYFLEGQAALETEAFLFPPSLRPLRTGPSNEPHPISSASPPIFSAISFPPHHYTFPLMSWDMPWSLEGCLLSRNIFFVCVKTKPTKNFKKHYFPSTFKTHRETKACLPCPLSPQSLDSYPFLPVGFSRLWSRPVICRSKWNKTPLIL